MTYPILLAHGVARFDQLWGASAYLDNTADPRLDGLHYFKGLRTMLLSNQLLAFHANTPWAAGVRPRARALASEVRNVVAATSADKVNIVAHSMGGLDARRMLFEDEGVRERVASLTTISSPHAGSSFADYVLSKAPFALPLARRLGLNLEALRDLTTAACRRFNQDLAVRRFEDRLADQIELRTYAGQQSWIGTFELLKPAQRVVAQREGANDGLVSVSSAIWREGAFQGVLDETDHLNELGWWDASQLAALEGAARLQDRIHAFYLDLARSLP